MTNINVLTMQDLSMENVDGFFPILIDIYNPDISWSNDETNIFKQENSHIRLICDDQKVIYNNKVYIPCSFSFQPPETDGGKIGNATISITALDYRIRKVLRSIGVVSELNIISAFKKVEKENTGKFVYKFVPIKSAKFSMSSATVNRTTATFTLTFDRSLSQSVPYDLATQERVLGTRG